ncbi:MAG: YqiA/YcfP family alpha/beta fold hydrolase [Rubrivivax sp.]|nr:esterase [Rubrivivax sp.]
MHGFRSSPLSFKAQRLAAWCRENRPDLHWACPQLPPSPREAIALCEGLLAEAPIDTWAVLGSSLGGFYATVLHQRHGLPAVLINPAVAPARDLAAHIGEQQTWHRPEDRFFFRPEYVAELQSMTQPGLRDPARVLAVLATGDEVLSFAEMAERYAGARQHVVHGSDHALSDFEQHLPVVLDFIGLHRP